MVLAFLYREGMTNFFCLKALTKIVYPYLKALTKIVYHYLKELMKIAYLYLKELMKIIFLYLRRLKKEFVSVINGIGNVMTI
jgi:hypothetical protein